MQLMYQLYVSITFGFWVFHRQLMYQLYVSTTFGLWVFHRRIPFCTFRYFLVIAQEKLANQYKPLLELPTFFFYYFLRNKHAQGRNTS